MSKYYGDTFYATRPIKLKFKYTYRITVYRPPFGPADRGDHYKNMKSSQ
jgi:hypothetical protein